METTTTETGTHVFETAGLGKAPFRFVGMKEQDLCYGQAILNRAEYQRTGILVTTKPGGTCAYCGNYIVNMCDIVSADGKRFHVGTDCVLKAGDAGLRKLVSAAVAKRERAQRAARDARKTAEAKSVLSDETARAKLAALPHPNTYRAQNGATLLDWAEWMLAHAGAKGRAQVAAAISKAIS